MNPRYPTGKNAFTRFLFTFLVFVNFSIAALAGTYTVSNTNDVGAGSFRQALTDALAAGVGPHTIDATGVIGTISLQTVLPDITNITLTINGPTANTGTLTITRGVVTNFRIFFINNSLGAATCTINRLLMTNGNPGNGFTDYGGGIRISSATVTLNHCTVSGCSASATDGGGISLEGDNPSLTIDACTISGNTANRGAGLSGINVTLGTATLNITNSTISGNTSLGNAAGMNLTQTTAAIKNCTISGNTSVSNGGGVNVGSLGIANLINCTITNNRTTSGIGGGIRGSSSNTIALLNTLVVGNFTGAGTAADDVNWTFGSNKSTSYSVIGANSNGAFNSYNQSQEGTPGTPVVVNLGSLANNGGVTQTHRLLTSVPELAKDKGSAPVPALLEDQRSANRVVDDALVANAAGGDGSDIGAYEMDNFVWTGASSSVFNNIVNGNWADGVAPSASSTVYVLEGAVTNEPSVSTNATVSNLIVDLGRTVGVNIAQTLTVSGTLTNNGTIRGTGTITTNFVNTGTVAPGFSAGRLFVTGNYVNAAGSIVDIELGEAVTPGTDYDQLTITGNAFLGNTLNVSLINGFTPSLGDQFVIMTFAVGVGTFSTTSLPSVAPNSWSVLYNPTNVTLEVVNVLPLKLLNFSGRLINSKDVQLNWQTTEESNLDKYEIQVSNDGNSWSKIGELKAFNKSTANNYSYLHTPTGLIAYYRLKMIDMDDKYTYSNIIAVRLSDKSSLQVFPNPAKDILFVQASGKNEQATVQVIDGSGKKMQEKKVMLNGQTSLSIDIKGLPAGIFYLLLHKQSGVERQRFIKQ